jgi:hypothetical protein
MKFPILYEKLPYFCFSCGLLGHSASFCPSPGETDENGDWLYDSSLRASDPKKIKKEQGAQQGGRVGPDGGMMRQKEPGVPPTNTAPMHAPNPFVGLGKNSFGADQPGLNFRAQGRGRGKPTAARKQAMGTQTYVPKGIAGVGLELVGQGTKRNALANTPSKVDDDLLDLKKKRAMVEDVDDLSMDVLDNQNLAEAEDQPRESQ